MATEVQFDQNAPKDVQDKFDQLGPEDHFPPTGQTEYQGLLIPTIQS